jgi:uncharacterized protein
MTKTAHPDWPALDAVLREPTLVLTTFRKSGIGVPTGVWAARIDGRYLFTTPSSTAKVKRLAHTEKVTFGPGDRRGRATQGPVTEAVARRIEDPAILMAFRSAMRRKGAVTSRVIELMYTVKRKDERLVFELTRLD